LENFKFAILFRVIWQWVLTLSNTNLLRSLEELGFCETVLLVTRLKYFLRLVFGWYVQVRYLINFYNFSVKELHMEGVRQSLFTCLSR